MKFFTLILILLINKVHSQSRIVIRTSESKQPQCGPNEEFIECGTPCGETCEDSGKVVICANRRSCKVGWFCFKGLFRNRQGICVPLEDCERNPIVSDTHELHDDHRQSSEEDFSSNSVKKMHISIESDNQRFIRQACPVDEVYSDCGSRCSESCYNIFNPTVCPPNMCDIGCFCKVGLYRNQKGICVHEEECRATGISLVITVQPQPEIHECPKNEKFKKCGCHCLEMCENRYSPGACPLFKKEFGCFCIKGYFRNRHGVCVEEEACDLEFALPLTQAPTLTTRPPPPPPRCLATEQFNECGSRCLESCDNIDNPSDCPEGRCDFGCFCKPGLYRDQEGICVPEPECEVEELVIRPPRPPPRLLPLLQTPSPMPSCPNHEMYSKCGNRCLESVENMDNPSVCLLNRCDIGCFCIKSYFRSRTGICIKPYSSILSPVFTHPLTITPQLPPKCSTMEQFSKCGSRCLESCDNINNPSVCLIESCDIGCFCKLGTYKNKGGFCVPVELCKIEKLTSTTTTTAIPSCPDHEAYTECGNRCMESIDNINNPSACPSKRCDIGCFCIHGFYRYRTGVCVLPLLPSTTTTLSTPLATLLPIQCLRGEQFRECGSRCLESCSNIDNLTVCQTNRCDIGCFCNPGLYRRVAGICVPEELCEGDEEVTTTPAPTSSSCPKHEIYSKCGNRCLESIDNMVNPYVCPLDKCDIGCFCIKGYFRSRTSICMKPDSSVLSPIFTLPLTTASEPPPRCSTMEQFSGCGSRCLESCENIGNPSACPPNKCDIGCFCKPGLYRDEGGTCVPIELCVIKEEILPVSTTKARTKTVDKCPTTHPPQCPPHEEYSQCKSRCLELCTNKDDPSVCTPNRCDVGCFCQKGLYRNDEGNCVKSSNCPEVMTTQCTTPPLSKCPEGEVFVECASRCAEYCINSDDSKFCPPNECQTGCFCEKGRFRDDTGICVLKEECDLKAPTLAPKPPLQCPENEEYDSCGTRCGESCEELYELNHICSTKCETGCFCRDGFLRNCFGVCIQKKDCDLVELSDKTIIVVSTEGLHEETKSTRRPCGHNEEHTECGDECGRTCVDHNTGKNCPKKCRVGCFCKDGYLRDDDGKCVLPDQCSTREPKPDTTTELLKTCGLNERYICGSDCGQSCKLFTQVVQELCPPDCKPGCYCNEGLYRDMYANCVPQDQCTCDLPPTVCLDENEEYFSCFNECGRTCKDFNQELDDKCTDKCARGCFCIEGYVRNEEGICVKPETCDKSKQNHNCSSNEVYLECGTECGHQCTDIGKNPECNQKCSPGCYCPQGFYRAEDTYCVTKEECFDGPPTQVEHNKQIIKCGVNEEYKECGNFCDENCEKVFDKANCPLTCEKGCHCIEGFKRNKTGICISVNECNDLEIAPTCGINETYSECGTTCGYRCSDIYKDIHCPLECQTGCFCNEGFFRDSNGVCISKKDCPTAPTQCQNNEVYSTCSKHCGETCEDLLNPIQCSDECESGCFCQEGFYRDLEGNCGPIDVCNLPTTLAPEQTCPVNEEFDECGNKCSESCEESMYCSKKCDVGCFCIIGFLRNKSGDCVPEKECKKQEQCIKCGPNEYYTSCGSDCGNFCSDLGRIPDCTVNCNKGCFCKYGFYRNQFGNCVTRDKCTQRRSKSQEFGVYKD